MAIAGVIGLSTGKRLLTSSFYSSDLNDKFFSVTDHGSGQFCSAYTRNPIVAQKSSNFGTNHHSNRETQAIRALKEHVDAPSITSTTDPLRNICIPLEEEEILDVESSLEALILLQKSMLEKQWKLTFDQASQMTSTKSWKTNVTRSGLSARQRRNTTRKKCLGSNGNHIPLSSRRSIVSPELLQRRVKGYVRGTLRKDLLSHTEVVLLSKKIKVGLSLEEHRERLKEKLGSNPSDKQLASSLRISYAEVQSKLIACALAREKLAISNVRLVLSVAQKYDNLGAEMADLVQGGLIGLVRGIEKFDSSKGFRMSTYVYWWIRQGVSKALVENSRTLRLPSHLHERLSSIRSAKIRLEDKGIVPSIDKIAETLNLSEKKIRNATEAVAKVFSLDREAFPSLNGLPGETLHSYIADTRLENNPWHGYEEWSIKDEVNKLLFTALGEREREIIRLYYGLDSESHTWEEISRQIGLSRERVRQVGLVALEKLKHAARRKKLEAMLVKH